MKFKKKGSNNWGRFNTNKKAFITCATSPLLLPGLAIMFPKSAIKWSKDPKLIDGLDGPPDPRFPPPPPPPPPLSDRLPAALGRLLPCWLLFVFRDRGCELEAYEKLRDKVVVKIKVECVFVWWVTGLPLPYEAAGAAVDYPRNRKWISNLSLKINNDENVRIEVAVVVVVADIQLMRQHALFRPINKKHESTNHS